MSLKNRVITGFAWFSFSDISITAMNFLAAILTIQALGTFEFGILTLSLSAFAILSLFLDMGISTFLVSDIAQEMGKGKYSRAKSLLQSYRKLGLFTGIAASAIAFLSSFYLRSLYNELVGNMMAAISVFLLLNSIKNIFTVTFHGLQDFKSVGMISVYEMFFRLVFVIIFLVFLNKGIVFVIASYSIALLLSILLMRGQYKRHMAQFSKIQASEKGLFAKYVRSHGKWVILSFPLKRTGEQIHYWITEFFLGVNAVAILNVAMRFYSLLSISFQSLEGILTPIVSEKIGKSINSARFILARNLKYAFWASIVIMLASVSLSETAVRLLFPPAYLKSVPLFNLLAITLLFAPFSLFLRTFFTVTKNQKYQFYVFMLDLPLLIFFEVVLVKYFGLIGIPLSLIANGMTSLLIRYYFLRFFRHRIKISLSELCKIDDYDRKLLKSAKRNVRIRFGF
ncbi:MAG: oligosaccharide flippase family protein [Candidatus Aenigmarchaeota archaeon]|nr:oligosaccharide flippase family protein [Candidatus Aenigmarchaeota archaeon]